MSSPPVVLGAGMVQRALFDKAFMETVPEFRTLQPKLQTMRVNLTSTRGCSSCRKRRVARNLFVDFLRITQNLSPDGVGRLKRYFGAEQLMYNAMPPGAKTIQTVVV